LDAKLKNNYLQNLGIKESLNISGKVFSLKSPVVMGILNITPDSFYVGSRHGSTDSALNEAEKMLENGADMIDVGGYSSRPGAEEISEKEEISRIRSVVEALSKHFPEAIISIDTFRSAVASVAMNSGAHLINDISGGQADSKMFEEVAKWKCPYILMHMKGTPQSMMHFTDYQDMLSEIIHYFSERIQKLRMLGIGDVIIDPGFGFSKDIDQNYELLRNLDLLKVLEIPILSGISRKSMIYKKLGITSQEALNGTTVLNSVSLIKGASILRVHDVKEAVEAVKLYKEIYCD